MHLSLWYLDVGNIPFVKEAKVRLEYLREHGESEFYFSFKSTYSTVYES
jgi:hypothetical protein